MINLKCPQCGSSELRRRGWQKRLDNSRVQCYKCKSCSRSFLNEYRKVPAQPAKNECPCCKSFKTVKVGKPIEALHGKAQLCKCKSCGKHFHLGGRKRLKVFLKGEEIYSGWYPPGWQSVHNIPCPACKQEKAVIKTELNNTYSKGRILVCFSCGHQFREGAKWHTGIHRMVGEAVPRYVWQFEEDIWDLRELYPNVEEHEFDPLFLDFNHCGPDWLKELVKNYLLSRIQAGFAHRSLSSYVSLIGLLGCYLQKCNVISMENLSRLTLAAYWTQERGHLSRNVLSREMSIVKGFLDWGNAEKRFTTSPTLITAFDKPKVFRNEPEPLEDFVLEAIRDNLHMLPEPLQLMFMLGFWLGSRPGELCRLPKECLKLDPNGTTWWIKFERQKITDENKLPTTTDFARLIQQQQSYITELYGEDYRYLFCHYQGFRKSDYPKYAQLKAVKRPPITNANSNPMVKAIRHLIEQCNIRDSNGHLATFTGAILRPSRATQLIREGFSLEFVRIWLKHRSATTTKQHYIRYRPGELLDVACVMANLDGRFYSYDSNPQSLQQNPELHELDGLKMPNGEPLYGYCTFREFCPRFGHCYTCGFHIASSNKLPHYKAQLERLRVKKSEVFNYGSSEMLESYTQIVNALEGKIEALENPKA